MLSPEAERVLRYLVEVEELAEEVLADKRQVEACPRGWGPGLQLGLRVFRAARGVRNPAPACASCELTYSCGPRAVTTDRAVVRSRAKCRVRGTAPRLTPVFGTY